jgi:hypothetical protein
MAFPLWVPDNRHPSMAFEAPNQSRSHGVPDRWSCHPARRRRDPVAGDDVLNLRRQRRIMIRRYESKMAGYAFGSSPPNQKPISIAVNFKLLFIIQLSYDDFLPGLTWGMNAHFVTTSWGNCAARVRGTGSRRKAE